jgi:hypothetical protein
MPGDKSRHFGNIRKLPSGRFQARYRGPAGRMRSAPTTFERKSDASRWLTFKEAEITRGDWIAPELAKEPFGQYAQRWMSDRVLKIRTEELYRGPLRSHLLPTFNAVSLGDIDEAAVRRWRKERLEAGKTAERPFGAVTVAMAYRRSNFRPIWTKARTSADLPGLHFHDLRHTGGTLTAATGASLKELMARLGHSSVRAAMIYQHATRDRDQAIAKALGGLVREVRAARNDQAERTEREA